MLHHSESSKMLGELFNHYGSDKASTHNYYLFYDYILKNREDIENVLEIGLGTNNEDVVSSMGSNGKPGASLRAFRDFLPNAMIWGADIDERVLFQEDRITTYQVDQTKLSSLNKLAKQTPNNFDLMIDDGLHSPDANINSLSTFLPKIKIGGWAVIEDIPFEAKDIWVLVGYILPDSYQSMILETNNALMFACNKIK